MEAQPTRQRTLLRRLWETSPAKVYRRLRRMAGSVARPAPSPPPPVAPALGRPPQPPTHPPRKLLFLSDCYLAAATWAPFHRTVLGYLSRAVESVLAVRANAFFAPWSDEPRSPAHLDHLRR